MSATSTLRVAAFTCRRAVTRGNRGVVLLTTVMMAVIFAELLFIPSLIGGATDRIEQEFRDNVTADITITPGGSAQTVPDPTDLVARARATPGVAAATATIIAGSQVSSGSHTGSWSVLAVDPASYGKTFTTPAEMIQGEFLAPGDADGIVLGVAIAGAGRAGTATYGTSLRNVRVGDEVTVTLLGSQTHRFRVKGIYDSRLSQANQRAFISQSAAARLVPALQGRATAVYVKTRQLGGEAAVIARLRRARPDVVYEPWQTLETTVKDLTGSFDAVRSILNVVSLLVAAIAVFIVTYVDLVNRRRTIGIERAIGINGVAIILSYVLRAVALAIVGVLLGAVLFTFGAVPISVRHPFEFPIGPVSLSVTGQEMRGSAIVLVTVAAVGALAPAWRSVRLRIIDAIWG